MSSFAHLVSLVDIPSQCGDGVRNLRCRLLRQESGLTVDDNLRQSSTASSNNRQTASHSLCCCKAERFLDQGGNYQNIHRIEKRRGVDLAELSNKRIRRKRARGFVVGCPGHEKPKSW